MLTGGPNSLPSITLPGLTLKDEIANWLSRIFSGIMVGVRTAASFPSPPSTVMGLPPLYIHTTDSNMDVVQQIETNFPVLTIEPLNVKPGELQGSQDVLTSSIGVLFKYAVQIDNSINISHSNTYAQSQITDALKQSFDSNTMRDIQQLGKVYANTGMNDIMRGVMNSVENAFKSDDGAGLGRIGESIHAGIAKIKESGNARNLEMLKSVGRSVIDMFASGARIDFPNVWQDSTTDLSHSFTIELRTFATQPSEQEYIDDIITPLEILMHLALPLAESSMAYIEPPYIKAYIPNVFEIRLGGITNMSWSTPLSELNLRGIPRHIQVNLTITDLYNVMVNDKENRTIEHAPTLQKYLNHLKTFPDHDVANKKIWQYEFGRTPQTESLIIEGGQDIISLPFSEKDPTKPNNYIIVERQVVTLNSLFSGNNIKNIIVDFDEKTNKASIYYKTDENGPLKMLTNFNNVKDIMGADLSKNPIEVDLSKETIQIILN